MTHPGETSQRGPSRGEWRRWALILIVLGLMSVSIGGQVDSIGTKLDPFFAYVFAIGNDAAAILALDAALKAGRGSSVRKWAWVAIGLAAGTGGVLNAWHATVERTVLPNGGHELPELPGGFGLLVGLEPIALILVLSHLVGLVLTDPQDRQTADADAGARWPPAATDRKTASTSAAAGERQTAGAGATDRQADAGDRQATTVVVTAGGATDRPTGSPARPTAAAGDRAAAGTPSRRPVPAARGSLHALPAPRQGWMTDDLIARVVASMAAAQRRGEPYGRPRLMREHGLNSHRARTLLDHIAEHQLLRETA